MATETKEEPVEEEEMGGLDDGDDECLILISSEDDNPREFEISRKAALMCNLVKSILEGGNVVFYLLYLSLSPSLYCYNEDIANMR